MKRLHLVLSFIGLLFFLFSPLSSYAVTEALVAGTDFDPNGAYNNFLIKDQNGHDNSALKFLTSSSYDPSLQQDIQVVKNDVVWDKTTDIDATCFSSESNSSTLHEKCYICAKPRDFKGHENDYDVNFVNQGDNFMFLAIPPTNKSLRYITYSLKNLSKGCTYRIEMKIFNAYATGWITNDALNFSTKVFSGSVYKGFLGPNEHNTLYPTNSQVISQQFTLRGNETSLDLHLLNDKNGLRRAAMGIDYIKVYRVADLKLVPKQQPPFYHQDEIDLQALYGFGTEGQYSWYVESAPGAWSLVSGNAPTLHYTITKDKTVFKVVDNATGKEDTYTLHASIRVDEKTKRVLFLDDFGTLTGEQERTPSEFVSPAGIPGRYTYIDKCLPIKNGGEYAIVANPKWAGCGEQASGDNSCDCMGSYWYKDIHDHTQNATYGGMLLLNCNNDGDIMYERVADVCKNTFVSFSVWVASAYDGNTEPINAKFILRNADTNEELGTYEVTDIDASNWYNLKAVFNSKEAEKVKIQLVNYSPYSTYGNDLLVDDVELSVCTPEAHVGHYQKETQTEEKVKWEKYTRLKVYYPENLFVQDPYIIWQMREEGQTNWTNVKDEGGIDYAGTANEYHYVDVKMGLVNLEYRAVVANTKETADAALAGESTGPCGLYAFADPYHILLNNYPVKMEEVKSEDVACEAVPHRMLMRFSLDGGPFYESQLRMHIAFYQEGVEIVPDTTITLMDYTLGSETRRNFKYDPTTHEFINSHNFPEQSAPHSDFAVEATFDKPITVELYVSQLGNVKYTRETTLAKMSKTFAVQKQETSNAGLDQIHYGDGNFNLDATPPSTGYGHWKLESEPFYVFPEEDRKNPKAVFKGLPVGKSQLLSWTIVPTVCPWREDFIELKNLPDFSIALEAPKTHTCVGTEETFYVKVTNPHKDVIPALKVKIPTIPGLDFTSLTADAGTWDASTHMWTIDLAGQTTAIMTIKAKVNQAATLLAEATEAAGITFSDKKVQQALTIDQKPAASLVETAIAQCDNGTFNVQANLTAGTGVWSLKSGDVGTIANPNAPITTVSGVPSKATTTVYYTVSNGVCPEQQLTATLTNNNCQDYQMTAEADQTIVCMKITDVNYTFTFTNKSPTFSLDDVEIKVNIPSTFQLATSTPATGSEFDATTGIWKTNAPLAPNGTLTLVLNGKISAQTTINAVLQKVNGTTPLSSVSANAVIDTYPALSATFVADSSVVCLSNNEKSAVEVKFPTTGYFYFGYRVNGGPMEAPSVHQYVTSYTIEVPITEESVFELMGAGDEHGCYALWDEKDYPKHVVKVHKYTDMGDITAPDIVCDGQPLDLTLPSLVEHGDAYEDAHWNLNGAKYTPGTHVNFEQDQATLTYSMINHCHNSTKTTTSNPVQIQVRKAATIADIHQPAAICSGSALNLPTEADMQATITKNNATVSAGKWILNGAEFDPASTVDRAKDGQQLHYEFTSSCSMAPVKTNAVTVTVHDVATITDIATPAAICAGEALVLPSETEMRAKITTNGSAISKLHWVLGGAPYIPGTPLAYTDNGKSLHYEFTSSCSSTPVKSNEVAITVHKAATITDITAPAAICAGNTLTLPSTSDMTAKITTNGSTITNAHWVLGGTTLDPSSTLAYTDNNKALHYEFTSSCAADPIKTNAVTVTVNDVATIGTLAAPAPACDGTTLDLPTETEMQATIDKKGSTVGAGKWILNGAEFDPSTPLTMDQNNQKLHYEFTSSCSTTPVKTNEVDVKVQVCDQVELTASVSKDNICTNSMSSYIITVKNTAAVKATGVTVKIVFPADLFVSTMLPNNEYDRTTQIWTVPDMEPNQLEKLTIICTPDVTTTFKAHVVTLNGTTYDSYETSLAKHTQVLNVVQKPTTANAGIDIQQCQNGDFQLAANVPSVGTGKWTVDSSIASGAITITDPTDPATTLTGLSEAGVVTLAWTISNDPCESSIDKVELKNFAAPAGTIGANQEQCNNGTFTVSANPTVGTGTWSIVSAIGPVSIDDPSAATTTVRNVPTELPVKLAYTISNGTCTDLVLNMTLTNHALPSATITDDAIQCNDGDFALEATSVVGTGVWSIVSGDGALSSTTAASTQLTGVTAGTSTKVQYTVTNGNCSSSVYSATMTNEAQPTLAMTVVDPLTSAVVTDTLLNCKVPTLRATVSGAHHYQWKDGTTETQKTFTKQNAKTRYEVIGYTANNCASKAYAVYVDENFVTPNLSIVTNPASTTELNCTVQTIQLLASVDNATAMGGVSYKWNDDGLSTTANLDVTTPDTYTVTATGANGCTQTKSQIITQNIVEPNLTLTANPATTELNCAVESIQLKANVDNVAAMGGVTYLWNDAAASTTDNLDVTTPATYTVTATGANGCTKDASQAITQDVVDPVLSIAATVDQLNCTDIESDITVTVTNADRSRTYSYQWDKVTDVTPTITVTAPNTYEVKVTDNNNKCANLAKVTITQNIVTPNLSIVTDPALTTELTCAQTSIDLIAQVSNERAMGGVSYKWEDNTILAGRTITEPATYTVTATGANGCEAEKSMVITQDVVKPTVTISTTADTLTCLVPNATLTANANVPVTYEWGIGDLTQSITTDVAGRYSVEVTAENGCKENTFIELQDRTQAPVVNVTASAREVTCEPVDLTATGALTYEWSTGETTPTIEVDAQGDYTVVGTNRYGCTHTVIHSIREDKVDPELAIDATIDQLNCTDTESEITVTVTNADRSRTYSYTWDKVADVTPTITVNAPDTYEVQVKDDYNACWNLAKITITQDIRKPVIDLQELPAVCLPATINLRDAVGPATTGDMIEYASDAAMTAIITNPVFEVTTGGTYYVQAQEVDGNGCMGDVESIPVPLTPVTPVPTVVDYDECPVAGTKPLSSLVTSDFEVLTFYDQAQGGRTIDDSFDASAPLTNNTYWVSSTNIGWCESERTPINVFVDGLVDFELNASHQEIAIGEDMVVDLIPASVPVDAYIWTKNGEVIAVEGDQFVEKLYVDATYKVSATGRCNSLQKEVSATVKWPTAMTPYNQNGKNDVFAKGFKITVFNRFSEPIFTGDDGWDGTINTGMGPKGKLAMPGNYYYYIALPDGSQKRGSIEVVKM